MQMDPSTQRVERGRPAVPSLALEKENYAGARPSSHALYVSTLPVIHAPVHHIAFAQLHAHLHQRSQQIKSFRVLVTRRRDHGPGTVASRGRGVLDAELMSRTRIAFRQLGPRL